MKTVGIQCATSDWDASLLIIGGLANLHGRTRLPKTLRPTDFPADKLEQWHELVRAIGGIDPGGWAAQHIAAELRDEDVNAPVVHLTIARRWDDGTTADPLEMDMGDNLALDFFGWLTRDEQTVAN